jgi:integrase
MRWSDLDRDNCTWSIPAERTKSNRAQLLPLAPTAMAIIERLPRLTTDLVFSAVGNDESTFSGFSKAKRRLDQLSGGDDWTLHDLRRTAATGMARLGVAPHVVERILNHTTGSLGGVAGIYNRFGYLPEMANALKLWAAHVEAVASGGDKDCAPKSGAA